MIQLFANTLITIFNLNRIGFLLILIVLIFFIYLLCKLEKKLDFVLSQSGIKYFFVNARGRVLWSNTSNLFKKLKQISSINIFIVDEFSAFVKTNIGASQKVLNLFDGSETVHYKLSISRKKIFWMFGEYFYLQISDVSSQIKISEKLNILQTAIDKNAATILITDKEGIISYVNEKFSTLTQYSIQDALGENPRILKSGFQDKKFYEEMWDTISSGKEWRSEFHNKKKNGEFYWEQSLITPILNSNNEVTHYVAIKEDITELKKKEQYIKEYIDELEELNATKDKFFSIIAHDLKNPFSVIYGLSELMTKKIERLENDDFKNYIRTLDSSVKQFYTLLDKLLSWSRLQRGKIKPKFEKVEVSSILDLEIANYQSMAKLKGVFVQNTSFPPIFIYSDQEILSTIIRNLLNNAVKYSESGDIVTLHSFIEENKVFIIVQDEGVGMSKEQKNSIFKVNAQSTPGTNNEKGTGLGLTLVHDFVKILNLELDVVSEINVGTKFIIKGERFI